MEPNVNINSRNVLLAGAAAGLAVDLSLFPIDTVKSRLQSKPGFFKSGGFSNLYRGVSPILVGSIPTAALFFLTYETCKQKLNEAKSPINGSSDVHHIVAASLGELVSCAIRVPCEVVKMRAQTTESKIVVILEEMLVKGGLKGIYRGFFSTVMRDIPFSIVQYPIWEKLKELHLQRKHQHVNATQSAAYGSIAGAIAAFVTTPIDVAKSRIMLARNAESLASGKVIEAMRLIYQEDGIRGCFAGVVPRVIWISLGAAIFLGTYERVCAPRVF